MKLHFTWQSKPAIIGDLLSVAHGINPAMDVAPFLQANGILRRYLLDFMPFAPKATASPTPFATFTTFPRPTGKTVTAIQPDTAAIVFPANRRSAVKVAKGVAAGGGRVEGVYKVGFCGGRARRRNEGPAGATAFSADGPRGQILHFPHFAPPGQSMARRMTFGNFPSPCPPFPPDEQRPPQVHGRLYISEEKGVERGGRTGQLSPESSRSSRFAAMWAA